MGDVEVSRTSRPRYRPWAERVGCSTAEASTDLERHGALSANHIVDSPGPNLTIVPEPDIELLTYDGSKMATST